ncbi:MAG: hypothetical protein ACYTHM_03565 [Planctomycetota bacterium]
MKTLKLTAIKCLRPEEREDHPYQPGDELRLDARVDGEEYFTVAVWRGKGFVKGTKQRIDREWKFEDRIVFRLMEENPYTPDDNLGEQTVTADADPAEPLRFTDHGAEYTIEFTLAEGGDS